MYLVLLLASALLFSVSTILIPTPAYAQALTLAPTSGPAGTTVTFSTSTFSHSVSSCSLSASSASFFSPSYSIICTVAPDGLSASGSFMVRLPTEISAGAPLPGAKYIVYLTTNMTLVYASATFTVKPLIYFGTTSSGPWTSTITVMETQTTYIQGWGFNASSTACTYLYSATAIPHNLPSGTTYLTCVVTGGELSGGFIPPHPSASSVPYNVTVLGNGNPKDLAQGQVTVTAGPVITPSPTLAPIGSTVSVTGSGFSLSDSSCGLSYNSTNNAGGALYTTTPSCSLTTVGTSNQPSLSFSVASSATYSTSTHPYTYYTLRITGSSGDYAQATLNVTAAPTFTLSPTSAVAGTTIEVATTPNVFSTLDSGTCKSMVSTPTGLFTSYSCSIYSNGTLNWAATGTSFIVSNTAAEQTYTVTVTGATGDSGSATFTPAPAITLSTTTGSPPVGGSPGAAATVVTVTGTGFYPTDTGCTITSTGRLSSGLVIDTSGEPACTINTSGQLSAPFNVGAGSVYGTTYNITVTASPSGQTLHTPLSSEFTVTPEIVLSPSSGTGILVEVSGSGFSELPTSASCTLTPGGASTATLGTCAESTSGTISGSFTANGPFGSYIVSVKDNTGTPSATAPFSVGVSALSITVSPTSGSGGNTIKVSGSGFSSGDTSCTIKSTSNTVLSYTCSVSGGAVTGSFVVVTAGNQAEVTTINVTAFPGDDWATTSFTVVPEITLTPTSSGIGNTITVTGSNFFTAGGTCVITSSPAGAVSSSAPCSIGSDYTVSGSFTVAAGASGAYTITVTDPHPVPIYSASAPFTVTSHTLTLTPTSGLVGASISYTGTGFSSADTCPGSTISGTPVSGAPVGCSSASAGTITGSFTVATGTTPGTYVITLTGNNGGSGDAGSASLTVTPGITLAPSSGGAGTTVQVSGSNFSPTDSSCTISSSPSSPSLILNPVCTVAAGSMTGSFTVASSASGVYSVTVTGTAGDAGTASFTASAARTLTLTPLAGPIGTVVTASGSNFAGTSCILSSSPGGLFTSSSCAISGGTLSGGFTVGSGATAGSYTVTATSNLGSSDSAGASFSVTVGPASTFSLSPVSGAAGTSVAVSGENYLGSSCSLSSSPSGLFASTPTCSVSSGRLTGSFIVATGASGSYTVTVTTNIASDTNVASFTIPTASFALTPISGAAGTAVSISGSNYAGTTCSVSSAPSGLFTSQTCSISSGTLTGSFTVASGASAGAYTVTLTTDLASETRTATFTVTSRVVTFVLTPASGPAGTAVTATGQNYVGTTCSLSSSPLGLFTSESCAISGGTLSAGFLVASGTSGSYTVTAASNAGEIAIAIFTVSSVAAPTFALNPTSGAAGTPVTISGANYAGTTCSLTSTPSGMLASSSCFISAGELSGGFTVASGVSAGGYAVTVTTDKGEQLSAQFTVTGATTIAATTASFTYPQCVIATATFGSEVAPAVQLLRGFRDNLVLKTQAGSAFMTVFNAWYYSFSPTVAGFIASHDPLRAPMRVILYPLLGILGVTTFTYSIFSSAPEFAIVIAGLLASSLIGLVYLTFPVLLGMRALLKRRAVVRARIAKVSIATLAISLLLLAVGEVAGSFVLLAIGSSAVVLTCIIAVPVHAALAIMRRNPK